MMYAIISKEECQRIGIDSTPRMAHGDSVVITDKELMFSTAIGKTLEEKAENVNAILATTEKVFAWDKACKLGNDGKEVLNG